MNAAEDSWHGKHVLVTGGSGFIGSNLIRHLAVRGALCTSVDLVEPGPGLPVDRAVLADITDQAAMRRCVAGADVVFPLAGRSGAVDSMSRAEEDLRLNCTAQLVLLENVRAVNPDARIVFPGSRLEYGEAVALPIDEDHRIRPSSPYALHKYSAGQYHLMYHRHFGLRTTVLRLSNPFG
ncbi:MAG: NAD-dependent epimerase/dehydratase family protein, partial [Coriobacteriia bacterium]|nr:NAD-dependent epimerase/dehydratase family protein [Coriobacteriia bacterium]